MSAAAGGNALDRQRDEVALVTGSADPLGTRRRHVVFDLAIGAHAPDEYFVIEATNPKVQGFDGAVMSYVEYLYELGR